MHALTVALAAPVAAHATAPYTGVNDQRKLNLGVPNLPGAGQAGSGISQAFVNLTNTDMTDIGNRHLRLRVDVDLKLLDPDETGWPAFFTWAKSDALFKTAALKHVKILPMLHTSSAQGWLDSSVVETFSNDVAAFVSRYKAGGAYWHLNPSLTPQPITAAEIWNEPNTTRAWQDSIPNYMSLLQQVWLAVNNDSPGFPLINGGLSDGLSDWGGLRPGQWLCQAFLYNRRGPSWTQYADPGNPWFPLSGVALHAYGAPGYSVAQAEANVVQFRADLSACWPGPTVPPLWITEFGWRWSATPNTFTDAQVSSFYSSFLSWLTTNVPSGVPTYAYDYRMTNHGDRLDDGMGLYHTVGDLLNPTDTTIANSGTPQSALTVLSSSTYAR